MAGTLSVQTIQGLATAADPTTVSIASGHTLHAPGHVIQVVSSTANLGVSPDVSWSASAGNPNQYGGLVANRTYVQATSVTITPKSTSSKLLCFGAIGWSSMAGVGTMAFGGIITLNDTIAIDISDYPFYQASTFASSAYWPTTHITGTFLPNSTSEQTIRLRPFVYMESSSSTGRYRGYSLIVQEIAQ